MNFPDEVKKLLERFVLRIKRILDINISMEYILDNHELEKFYNNPESGLIVNYKLICDPVVRSQVDEWSDSLLSWEEWHEDKLNDIFNFHDLEFEPFQIESMIGKFKLYFSQPRMF